MHPLFSVMQTYIIEGGICSPHKSLGNKGRLSKMGPQLQDEDGTCSALGKGHQNILARAEHMPMFLATEVQVLSL